MKHGLLLGLLAALGPLAIDLYLPAFPTLVQEFSATPQAVQFGLISFFVALALAQIPIGSLSDRFGRRSVLLPGLLLFALASAGCALAGSIQSLTVWRFFQGLGASTGSTLSRAMIRDLQQGDRAARLMAQMYLVLGISPILAPVVGSAILAVASWRTLFWGIAAVVIATLALTLTLLPETRAAHSGPSAAPAWHAYRRLLTDGRFLAATAVCALAVSQSFIYISGAPFLLTQRFGLSTSQFSVLLGLNAVGQILSAQLSPLLMRRLGTARLLRGAALCAFAAGAILLVLGLLGIERLALLIPGCLVVSCSVGLWLTPAAVRALDLYPQFAGAASAVMGTLQLLLAAGLTSLTSLLSGMAWIDRWQVMAGAFALCGASAWALSRRYLSGAQAP